MTIDLLCEIMLFASEIGERHRVLLGLRPTGSYDILNLIDNYY